jgi:DNA replication and repair protein RecF
MDGMTLRVQAVSGDAWRGPAGLARVAVRSLSLSGFRNYTSARLQLDGRPVVLTGDNGAGKTNLLEALSFFAPGRGLRGARLGDVSRHDADEGAGWAVAAVLDAPHYSEMPVRIGTGLSAFPEGQQPQRRVVRIGGVNQSSSSALLQVLGVIWLTPEMDRLFADGKSGRRQFFDRLVLGFDAEHGGRLNAYEKARQERSRLLFGELQGRRADPNWLDALEAAMAEHGVAVAAARQEARSLLRPALVPSHGPFPRAELALEGELENGLGSSPAIDVEDSFREALRSGRRRDREAGRALQGPHRSDLLVWHGESMTPAAICSTGQQKALLISIILANARLMTARATPPLLLLDEVAAHLDERRRAALFDAIGDLGVQAWMTGADCGLFSALGGRAQYFTAARGSIREAAH